jgi:hypothetical protein
MEFTTMNAVDYRVEIIGGQVTPPTDSTELGLQLEVFNRGNTQARIRGSFALLSPAGTLVGRGSITDTRYMPGQRKNSLATWAGALPLSGPYTCVVSLSYDRVGLEPTTLIYEVPFAVK